VVLRLEDQSGRIMTRGRTGTVRKGGKDPAWTPADTPLVALTYDTTPPRSLILQVEVRDEPDSGDRLAPGKLIGQAALSLTADVLLTTASIGLGIGFVCVCVLRYLCPSRTLMVELQH
jgi:hypothetical protein